MRPVVVEAAERLLGYGRIRGKVVRAGILIVGSLRWDEKSGRPAWHRLRLDMDRAAYPSGKARRTSAFRQYPCGRGDPTGGARIGRAFCRFSPKDGTG